MKFWIKERYNPQLGTYYVACGQMPIKLARQYERGALYGSNKMIPFTSQKDYEAKLSELRKAGKLV